MEKLILVGEIIDFFMGEKPITYIRDAKFIIVSTDGIDLRMIIFLVGYPHAFHAEAVKEYMDENGYTEICCHGGGKIALKIPVESLNIYCYDKSYSFGTPSDEILRKVAHDIWPDAEMRIMTSSPKITEGKIYTKGRIQYLIDTA
jgi:hypothetical protein